MWAIRPQKGSSGSVQSFVHVDLSLTMNLNDTAEPASVPPSLSNFRGFMGFVVACGEYYCLTP